MEITIILKGGTPDEIREALQKLAAAGEPGPIQEPQPIQAEVEDIAPLMEPEAEPQPEPKRAGTINPAGPATSGRKMRKPWCMNFLIGAYHTTA